MNPPIIRPTKPRSFSLSRSRKTMQWSFVAFSLLIGIRHILPGSESEAGSFDAFCPFGGIETLLPYLVFGHTLKTTTLLNFALLLGVLGTALVTGRAFCGWMCPLGTLQDFLAAWARRLTGERRHVRGKPNPALLPLRMPPSLDQVLRPFKYLVLVLVIIASLYTVFPPLHNFCAVRAIFSLKFTPLLIASGLVFVFISLLVERSFCKYFCPLGALLALFNRLSLVRVVTDEQRCNHCGRCDIDCSMDLKQVPDQTRSVECVRCMECLETCARDGSLTIRVG